MSGRYQRSLLKKIDSNDQAKSDEADNRILVELHSRCFNVTLTIQKHLKRCPWCPDPNLHIVVAGQQVFIYYFLNILIYMLFFLVF